MRYSFTWLQWERGHSDPNLSISACGFDDFSAITSTETCDSNDLVFRMFHNESFLTQLLVLPFVMYGLFPMHVSSGFTFCCSQVTFAFVLLKCQLCLRRKTLLDLFWNLWEGMWDHFCLETNLRTQVLFQRSCFRFVLPTHVWHICLCIFVVLFLAFTTVASMFPTHMSSASGSIFSSVGKGAWSHGPGSLYK